MAELNTDHHTPKEKVISSALSLKWFCKRWNLKSSDYPCDKMRQSPQQAHDAKHKCEGCEGAVKLEEVQAVVSKPKTINSQLVTENDKTPIRICVTCKGELVLDNFYKDKNSKDGHSKCCKECQKKSQNKLRQKYRQNNQNNPTSGTKTRTCNTCNRKLSLTSFSKNINRKDGFEYQCKECKNEKWKERYPAEIRGQYNKTIALPQDKMKELIKKLEVEEKRLTEKDAELKANRVEVDQEILNTIGELDGVNQALGSYYALEELLRKFEGNSNIGLGIIAAEMYETYNR